MTGDENGRTHVAEPRADGVREWETFVRTAPDESLRHVGSVTAPTAETAHEHAGALFPDAEALWLCPTGEVVRFATRTLGERGDDATGEGSAGVDGADEGRVEADADPADEVGTEAEARSEAEAGGDRP
ncbi:Htur_1727 family rSAM-partnered candidate RiPP [Salinigranum sp. GCM10025319]|uniref:Htur_1727 family rSAM-partnered candidate RiPP n=1 Tax=Salinigranum sp. GCM10025319 TaxID=3252687 RepID=UPI0036078EBA